MQQVDVNTFADYSQDEIGRRILFEDPVMRVLLVSMRAGQKLPEYAANALVTLYCVEGRVRFYEADAPAEMAAGALVRVAPGRPHRLEAEADSRLLVTIVRASDSVAWTALAPQGRELDLRQTPRERRHGSVFHAFETLGAGESFHIVNDHDPMPLRSQMEQRRPGEVGWDYEIRGPYEYRIRISRRASANGNC